ncbi:MAG: HAD family phosphatase [Ahrensia sp.]|nr:HAD family phosphatase [Ahrensia sp.]
MPDIELVIFDCDGTLMDSEMIAASVETDAMKPYGIEMTPREFVARFAGTSSETFKAAMEQELGRSLPDDHTKNIRNALNERLWREVKAIEGAQSVLDMFDQPRCICSNAPLEKLKIELTRGELWDRFRPYVFSAHELGVSKKPAPDVFLHAAKEFDVEPTACLVLEDSFSGITAARAAGMRAVGFTGGSHAWDSLADQLTEAGAETVINRLVDLPAVIEVFGEWHGLDG